MSGLHGETLPTVFTLIIGFIFGALVFGDSRRHTSMSAIILGLVVVWSTVTDWRVGATVSLASGVMKAAFLTLCAACAVGFVALLPHSTSQASDHDDTAPTNHGGTP